MNQFTKVLAYVVIVSNLYVGVLYINPPIGDRNERHVIKSRLIRVILITLTLTLTSPYILTNVLQVTPDYKSAMSILGFSDLFNFETQIHMLKTLALFMLLFIGPLFQHVIELDSGLDLHAGILGIFRDIIIAPITEELIYSSLSLSPFLAYEMQASNVFEWTPRFFINNESISKLVWLTPFLFGFAHLHHLHNLVTRKTPQPIPIGNAILIVSFQFIYTSLFGYLTNRILINTGNVWSCIIAHSFCNWLGFPSLDIGNTYNLSIRIIYWLLLIFGVWSFSNYFYILTASL